MIQIPQLESLLFQCLLKCLKNQKDAMESSVEIVIEKLLNVTKDRVPKSTVFVTGNANGTVFVTDSSDNLARVWNACKLSVDDTKQLNHEIDVLSRHENDVNYVQFSGCAVASRFSISENWKGENLPKFKNSWLNHDNIVTCSRDGSAIIWIPKSRRSHVRFIKWEKWSLDSGISSESSTSTYASSTSERWSLSENSTHSTWCKYDCLESR
ncbi:uncharacterized protein [Arachis hypogaea]|uniref:uncharacterized protein isoform X2 n=1 Tax=Arachis hypogaea TaxID=3818 RepID=UPI000DEC6ECB|nr:uncharacterized protein LOC112705686 isoform X2 [Arachis hypogaea]